MTDRRQSTIPAQIERRHGERRALNPREQDHLDRYTNRPLELPERKPGPDAFLSDARIAWLVVLVGVLIGVYALGVST